MAGIKRKKWQIEEIKRLVELWPIHSIEEISKIMDRNRFSIYDLADRIREEGYDLPNKKAGKIMAEKIKKALGK